MSIPQAMSNGHVIAVHIFHLSTGITSAIPILRVIALHAKPCSATLGTPDCRQITAIRYYCYSVLDETLLRFRSIL